MEEVRGEIKDGKATIYLSGRIDSNNAASVEESIGECLKDFDSSEITIDVENLEYISSAGLRLILRLRKTYADLRIIGASTEVYDIFDMTGFTQMMEIEKAYRVVSVEGCEEIGRGANGTIYRIDQDNVVKVYNDANALDDIQHEREVARTALVLGIPTAISYDVVKVGDSYGSVFELLNAKSFAKILATEPDKFDWCVDEYVKLLKKIHGTEVPKGKLPDLKETVVGWAEFMRDYLPEDKAEKLVSLVKAVPDDDHMIHGDYHTKNVELVGDEVLLIDMDTLAVGHPIFELASIYNALHGFYVCDKERMKEFQGYDYETGSRFLHEVFAKYLGTNSEESIKKVEEKAKVVGYTRLIRRSIRRGGLEDPERKKEIDIWTEELLGALDNVDTLLFTGSELDIEATKENLPEVLAFVDAHLEAAGCPMKEQMQIDVAVEEIFVNIASYAYLPEKGNATVRVEVSEDPIVATITFIDHGKPYDPLAKEDPDITLSAEEREIGGLGIFMVKKSMDDVNYEYKDGKNILTLKKNIK